jgi:Putative MetA-pathway of phenol degradation
MAFKWRVVPSRVVRVGLLAGLVVLGVAVGTQRIDAQGCVVAHSVGEVGGPDSDGGYLAPGHWQFTLDYRHLYSFRHYVGSVAQVYRQQGNSEVRNRINLLDGSLTYQITPRFSVEGTVPVEFASRRYFIAAGSINGAPATDLIGAWGVSGVGDVSFMGQGWIWDPTKNPSHNIQIGFGVQMPTGRDNIQDNFVEIPGTPAVNATADYSIQPGIGVWAIPVSVESFQEVNKSTQVYFNGSYLITPSETNGVANSSPPGFPAPAPQNAFVSAADEYLLQAGVGYMMAKVHGMTVTGGLRKEGVPAHDLIGGDEGFRRPGYAVSLEPGVLCSMHGGHDLITANIDRAVYRNRIASVPDLQLGQHGDAAFADWLWLASFQHRF